MIRKEVEKGPSFLESLFKKTKNRGFIENSESDQEGWI